MRKFQINLLIDVFIAFYEVIVSYLLPEIDFLEGFYFLGTMSDWLCVPLNSRYEIITS
jgi:hypothetical protein